MQKTPTIYVLTWDDVSRIEVMVRSLERALDTLFERRLIEPMKCPDDLEDCEAIADQIHKDYLF